MTPNPLTDIELLQSWKAGDKPAGQRLFDRYFDALYRFFHHRCREGAEDLVQRTFLGALEGLESHRGEGSFRGWLYGIARNQLLRHWRERQRDQRLDFGTVSLADLATPSRVLAGEQEQRLLLEALRELPLDLQIAVGLHYWEKLTGPELAQVLQIPEGTVRSRLRRGREALKERLEALAASPKVLASTLSDLDGWAESIAELL